MCIRDSFRTDDIEAVKKRLDENGVRDLLGYLMRK